MDLKQILTINDIRIFDIDKKFGESGYNISDLLNMPFYWAGWKQNPHCGDEQYFNIAKNTALNNPETILGRYYSTRTEDEKIPNLLRLYNTIDKFIDDKNFKNQEIYQLINDKNILFVHIRSGDFGYISDSFVNTVYNLSTKFTKVILFSGVNRNIHHTDENSNHNLGCRNNLLYSLNKILATNSNIYVYFAEPDYHICTMRLCKNLLVHRGGYSVMGTFINNGKIYYTSELPCINNQLWKNEMISKNIILL
jgi:hypothetical protein